MMISTPNKSGETSSACGSATATARVLWEEELRGRDVNEADRIRLASFLPWARETWSRDSSSILCLSELVAQQKGRILMYLLISTLDT